MKIHLVVATFCVVALLSLSLIALPASAGLLTLDCAADCDSPNSDALTWEWGLQPNGSDGWVNLTEQFGDEFNGQYDVLLSGTTDSDPVVSFNKEVVNTTSTSWIGYSIGLDPLGVATFVGTPTSDAMTLETQSATLLTFGLPSPVAPGQTVNFMFDVNIPSTGPFGVALSQAPAIDTHGIPEPATISLVALAALAVTAVGRKRRM